MLGVYNVLVSYNKFYGVLFTFYAICCLMASLNRDWLGSVPTKKVFVMSNSNVVVSLATQGLLAKYVSAANSADNKRGAVIDSLWADGVRSALLDTPKNGGSKEVRDTIAAALVLGFTATERHLLDSPIKSLKDHQKINRRLLQQKLGARTIDIKKALKRREEIEATGGDTSKPRPPKTEQQKLLESLVVVQKRIGDMESPTFNPVVASNLLKELIAHCTGLNKKK